MAEQRPDPFATVPSSPRFATPLAGIALLLGVAGPVTGLAAVAGPVGMALGLIAHIKGSKLGMPATVVAGVGLIVGLTVTSYLR